MALLSPKYGIRLGGCLVFKLLMGVGVGIVAGVTVYLLIDIFSKRERKIKPLISQNKLLGSTRINLIALIVMIGVLMWLKNIIPALIAGIIVVYLPYQISYIRQKKFRDQILEQLSTATNLFSNTFLITKNIPRAIETVGKRVPDPLGEIFRIAYAELTFGVPLEKVADDLAERIGLSYGYIFSSLLKTAQEQGDTTAPLFRDLSTKIAVAQDQQNFQATEISSVRGTNIFLLVLPVPMYLILASKFEETAQFVATPAGRIIFTLWLLSIVIWMFMDRMVVDS